MDSKFLLGELDRASKNVGATKEETPHFSVEVHELGILVFGDGIPLDQFSRMGDVLTTFFPKAKKGEVMVPGVASSFGAVLAMCPEKNAEKWVEIARRRGERLSGGDDLISWMKGPDTGTSSLKIVSHLTGQHTRVTRRDGEGYPSDPSDLLRCLKVLHKFPLLKKNFHRMAEVGPVWKGLVENWEDLDTTLQGEMEKGEAAPETYRKMQEIIDGARK